MTVSKNSDDMTPVQMRQAACFVWFLLRLDTEKFMREVFPYGLEPCPSEKDLEDEDIHTYDGIHARLRALIRGQSEVDDGTPEFAEYKRLLWWCDKVLKGEAWFPSQEAAQCSDAWESWVRFRKIKRGVYHGVYRRGRKQP